MLTPAQLDKLDRIHANTVSDIKSAEFPDEISSVLRAGFSRFLADAVDRLDRVEQPTAIVPELIHPAA
jgi:hypothetical protein